MRLRREPGFLLVVVIGANTKLVAWHDPGNADDTLDGCKRDTDSLQPAVLAVGDLAGPVDRRVDHGPPRSPEPFRQGSR